MIRRKATERTRGRTARGDSLFSVARPTRSGHARLARRTGATGWTLTLTILALAALATLQPAFALDIGSTDSNISQEQAESAFREANGLYAQGKHEEAAALYQSIIDGGFRNADVYYNLGNALYMSGDISGAVLSYERALRLSGSLADAAANLEFIREQLADRQVREGGAMSEALDRFLLRVDVGRMAAIVSLLYFIVIACVIAGVLRGAFPPWLVRSIVVVLAALAVSGGILTYRIHRTSAVKEAVIVVTDVPVRTGPGDDFVLEFRLHEGTKVRLRESRDNWARVSVEGTDLEGWLPENSIEEI
jgi:hypothetical protein